MSKILVAKLVRLGKNGDNFATKLEAEVLRTNAKVDDGYLKEFNANWKTTGQLYIVDEKATKEREEALNPKKELKLEDMKKDQLVEYIIEKEYDIDATQKKQDLIDAIKEIEKEDK